PMGHQDFVVSRKTDGFALGAVAQRGVECENAHKLWPLPSGQTALYVAAGTPTSFFFFRNGIILRSSAPTCSTFWFCAASRIARNLWRPLLFSAIQALANSPD